MNAARLREAVTRVDPAAVLVPARLLRRVIRADREVGTVRVPHHHLHRIARDRLLAIVSPAELGRTPGHPLPDELLLLPEPAVGPDDQTLYQYSRLLFHAEADRVFHRLDAPTLDRRLADLGRAEFNEARDVLSQEGLLADESDATAYAEFAALYLEIREFEPARLSAFFPSCLDRERVERVLLADFDAPAVAARTRLPGAARAPAEEHARPLTYADDATAVSAEALSAKAEQASRVGNLVRAAILQQRAMRGSNETLVGRLRGANTEHIERLTGRLLYALDLGERDAADWRAGITALLEPAASGYWNVEARLLYDLQKVCLDAEKPLFAADLVEWMVTLGRRPVKRPLPDLPLVLAVTHIRKAIERLAAARIDEATRKRLGELLAGAEGHLEERMRKTLRPKVAAALDAAGLVPRDKAEGLSRVRLVEELLDRVVATGALTLGDLRDAVARSRLKLQDVSGPGEFFAGDPLLRANDHLACNLDGIARRGEFYLRWMQSISSLFFGTSFGRMLTLYVLLPALASLFLLKGTDALIGEVGHVTHWLGHVAEEDDFPEEEEPPPHKKAVDVVFDWRTTFPAVAVFFLLVFHVAAVRRAVLLALYWGLWYPLRGVLYDLPLAVYRFRPLRAVLASAPFQLFMRLVGRPLLLTLPVLLLIYALDYNGVLRLRWRGVLVACGAWFALMALIVNTRWGRLIEERVGEGMGHAWELFHRDFLLGVWGFFTWLFRWIGDRLDQYRYGVDERLRFRGGESDAAFRWKLAVGLGWFAVVYVVRMLLIVFIEPQVNPIKHFPVVTVSHKLMLLAAVPIHDFLEGINFHVSLGWILFVLALIPGVFGFLAWELKENWRLYRANGSPTIDPEMVGSHGEHVINYIRPGFHSGTLPRLFARLRRASGAAAHRAEEGLHHAEHELRQFVERELCAPLAANGGEVAVGAVRLATNRVRVELTSPAGPPATLEFENAGGRLAAGFVAAGWAASLDGPRRVALENVLAAFLKRCGVDLLLTDGSFARRPLAWADWAGWCERGGGLLLDGVRVLPAEERRG